MKYKVFIGDKMTQVENKSFFTTFKNYIVTCAFFIVASVVVTIALPSQDQEVIGPSIKSVSEGEISSNSVENYIYEAGLSSGKLSNEDRSLALYRDPKSRGAVEWFYLNVTGNKEVTMAILKEAEANDIPLSLAFALAHTESRYRVDAVNKNTNASIDRGLFQLNNRSFPGLTEEEFFNPEISAKYGMSHLKHCLKVGGNEVTGVAMYNAGTNKVKSGRTPQSTLNYVGKIVAYQEKLERLFTEEVCPYFDDISNFGGIAVALLNNDKIKRNP